MSPPLREEPSPDAGPSPTYRSGPATPATSIGCATVFGLAFATFALWLLLSTIAQLVGDQRVLFAMLPGVFWIAFQQRESGDRPGHRDQDYWVEVTPDGVRISSWFRGWKGMTQELVHIPFADITQLTIDSWEEVVIIAKRDGTTHSMSTSYFRGEEGIRAFCRCVLSYRPDVRVVDHYVPR